MISPSLKNEVTRYIFSNVILNNELFQNNDQLIDFIVYKITLVMESPESVVIKQGDEGDAFYIIAKG